MMCCQQLFYKIHIEQPVARKSFFCQEVLRKGPEIGSEPCSHRSSKSPLRSGQDKVRHHALECRLEQAFQGEPPYLIVARDPADKIDYSVVQEWNPYFERCRHAHFISQKEKTFGQCGFCI